MKKQLSPALVAGLLLGVIVLVGLILWKQTSGAEGSGRIESNLGPVERDPEKFKKGIEELLRQERAAKGLK